MNRQRALSLLLILFLVGCQIGGWERITSEEGGFSVLMPDMPARHAGTLDTDLGIIPYHALLLEREDISYAAAYADSPKGLPAGTSPGELLDVVRDQAVGLVYGELNHETEIILDGHKGRELWISFSGGQSMMQARVFAVQDTVYLLIVITPAAKASAGDVQKFLDSFQLLENG